GGAVRSLLGRGPRYAWRGVSAALAAEKPHAVVELPLPPPATFGRNAPYMLNSMLGWWPIVNGYSGYLPESYLTRRVDLALFPADEVIAVLRRLDVTHVVVHREEFSHRWPAPPQRRGAARALRPVAAAGAVAFYRISGEERG